MHTGNLRLDVGHQCLPFFPTTGTTHVETSEKLAFQTVHTYFNGTTTQTTGHTGSKGTGEHTAEINGLQFDVVTIVCISHVNTDFIVLLSSQSTRESHRLSFHLAIGIEEINGLYTFVCRKNGGERTVGIVGELLNGYTTAKTASTRQLTRVVEEVAVSLIVGHTCMISERLCVRQRHNLTGILPRPCG